MPIRATILALIFASSTQLLALPPVEFNRDIRPILSDRCYYCHADEETQEADLRLDTREGALADGAIVPGKPDESELFYRITTDDEDDAMPPAKAKKPTLSAEEVEMFRRWIEEGAEYQGHWAFEPLAKPDVPEGSHLVDHFINRRLAQEAIEASPEADREILIRRVYLDLVGLLPTLEQVAAFVEDTRPDAYERLVDDLLANPHYGERWGRHWLDGARYADSHGYSVDGGRQMWPFRDWVIRAFNDDMAFDQFTIEQLAGDLLPEPTKSQLVATAFHRNTLINQEGGSDPEQFRVEATIDRVNTTGAVWLGLTVGCAQCHTHKFDPLKHREYYEMFAFFNSAEDRNNTGPTVEVAEGELFEQVVATSNDKPAPQAKASDKQAPTRWVPAKYSKTRTVSGAALHKRDDNSLLVDAAAKPNEGYQIVSTSELGTLAALRLRTLTDRSLPKTGPGKAGNGNFVLTGVKIFVGGEEQEIRHAFADHEQPGYQVLKAFDGDKSTGWAINVGDGSRPGAKMNANHEAVFVLSKPVEAEGKPIEVRLFHDLNENYLIGCFAIDFAATVPQAPAGSITPPEPKAVSGKVMVMRDLDKPRDSYILTRGDFTRPDKANGKLYPGVFAAIAPALPDSDQPRTRLDLAKWLVHPENPMTSRVTVNRMWMRYFGRGLVETEEDFGTQGSPPSHPDLLDALARQFIDGGWSMKAMHRLIVTSETYRRASLARPDLAEKDPLNLLLARQARVSARCGDHPRRSPISQRAAVGEDRRPGRPPAATRRDLCLHPEQERMEDEHRRRALPPGDVHLLLPQRSVPAVRHIRRTRFPDHLHPPRAIQHAAAGTHDRQRRRVHGVRPGTGRAGGRRGPWRCRLRCAIPASRAPSPSRSARHAIRPGAGGSDRLRGGERGRLQAASDDASALLDPPPQDRHPYPRSRRTRRRGPRDLQHRQLYHPRMMTNPLELHDQTRRHFFGQCGVGLGCTRPQPAPRTRRARRSTCRRSTLPTRWRSATPCFPPGRRTSSTCSWPAPRASSNYSSTNQNSTNSAARPPRRA